MSNVNRLLAIFSIEKVEILENVHAIQSINEFMSKRSKCILEFKDLFNDRTLNPLSLKDKHLKNYKFQAKFLSR